MANIPFKVSARAARLIGRENVANADGALIELIKNSYDADSDYCVIYFDIKYSKVPNILNASEFNTFSAQNNLVQKYYTIEEKNSNLYKLEIAEESKDYLELLSFFQSKENIYIMDNGVGMNDDVIKNHWMTIGTNYKELEIKSKGGRVRTGAKGIGRFALDRLGSVGQMFTKKENDFEGYEWNVNWGDFESSGATIDNVYADLKKNKQLDIREKIIRLTNEYDNEELREILRLKGKSDNGTIIQISNLRDNWTEAAVNSIFENLQTLIPPKEEKVFNIFLFNSLSPSAYGKVESSVCEDFDYKIEAVADENQNVNITIYRQEFNLKGIETNYFFNHKNIVNKPQFEKKTFEKELYSYSKTFAQLLSLEVEDAESLKSLEEIGKFSFSFYFLKRRLNKRDQQKFRQRGINSAFRMAWMEKFGGIKLFRDDFRVRPYGENGTSAFDWLELGQRSAGTTNAPAKSGWKVRPNMVAGVVNISRIANISFKDKSNREGIQQNDSFDLFKELLIQLIREFEKDRYPIMGAFADLYKEENKEEETKDDAEKIIKERQKKKTKSNNTNEEENDTDKIISAYQIQKEEYKEIENENKILKVLASTGLIVTAFTHELHTIQNNLINRADSIINVLKSGILDKAKYAELPEYKDPIQKLEFIKEQDSRLKQWLEFALNAVKKDKRRRRNIEIVNYFSELKDSWFTILEAKGVTLKIDTGIWVEIIWRGFAIDLDSIFNNLIVNSTEALKRRGFKPKKKEIKISLSRSLNSENRLEITYEDSGPGLSESITDANDIFEFNFSTKKDSRGKAIGTGIGMWIVKTIIDEYKGDIEILRERPKFKIKFSIPVVK